jgi:hypothetical protein
MAKFVVDATGIVTIISSDESHFKLLPASAKSNVKDDVLDAVIVLSE